MRTITKKIKLIKTVKNQRYKDVVDSLQDVVFEADQTGRLTFCNRKAYEIFGYTEKDFKNGFNIINAIVPEDREKAIENIQKILTVKSTGANEYTALRKDGTTFPILINSHPIIHKGHPVGIRGLIIDISRRKQAEKKALTAQKHLFDILEFLPDATFVVNREGTVIAWNRAIEIMTGVSKEQIIGKGNYAYTVPFYGQARPGLVHYVFKENIQRMDYQILREGETLYTEAFAPLLNDGKGAYLWLKASPLYDNDGNLVGGIESIRDITRQKEMEQELINHQNHLEDLIKLRTEELNNTNLLLQREINQKKRAEEALKESKDRLSLIFNNSSDLIFLMKIEPNGGYRLLEVNNAYVKVTGVPRKYLVGKLIETVLPKDIYDRVTQRYQQAINQGKTIHYEETNETPNGTLTVDVTLTPIFDDAGKCTHLIGFGRDISGQKKMEREMSRLDRLYLVGEMAAGISHEIRNPMTTVRGFLQLMGKKDICSEYKDFFNVMIEELDRANSIISEYLSLAKNKPVELKMKNINSIIETIFPILNANAIVTDKNIIFKPGQIPLLLLDEKEIRQLIINLVKNGLEAMGKDGRLTIRTYTEGSEIVLSVQDEGKGISPEALEKIGTPFFTTKEKGTGLGLATCYSIAARHNARINVQTGSTGTNFLVRFNIKGSI